MKIPELHAFLPITKMQDKPNSEAALKGAAEGFETLMTHQLVQELQKDLEGESLFGSGVEGNTIGAMAEWELAGHLAKSLDLGVLKQLQAAIARKETSES